MTTPTFTAMDLAVQSSTCPVTARERALTGIVVQRNYCRWGQDYDCQCNYCNDGSYAKALIAAKQQNDETAEHRAWIVKITAGLEALALIGRAVRAAASPGFGYSQMIQDAGALRGSFGGNVRGFSYRVVGKRGNAKQHFGKVGVCKWIGQGDEGTPRVGLQIDGEEKLAYCACSQLERIPMTAESLVADAVERTERVIVRSRRTARSSWPRRCVAGVAAPARSRTS